MTRARPQLVAFRRQDHGCPAAGVRDPLNAPERCAESIIDRPRLLITRFPFLIDPCQPDRPRVRRRVILSRFGYGQVPFPRRCVARHTDRFSSSAVDPRRVLLPSQVISVAWTGPPQLASRLSQGRSRPLRVGRLPDRFSTRSKPGARPSAERRADVTCWSRPLDDGPLDSRVSNAGLAQDGLLPPTHSMHS